MPAQTKLNVPIVIAWLCTGAAICTPGDCATADSIRLAVQKTGTVSWELDAMRAHQLDKQAGITIQIRGR
jgi:NitT/TauT family transport system substrate-binding protein